MKFNFGVILKAIIQVIMSLFKIFGIFLIPFVLLILGIIIMFFRYYIKYRYIEHYKKPRFKGRIIKEDNIFKRLLVSFPKQLAYDFVHKDPNDFMEFGIHMICGEQGAGKSTLAAYLLMKWQKQYPNLKVYTNMGYKYENDVLDKWQQLIERKNGKSGVVNLIDDVKAWWSNKDSKDLPPDVLAEICQQRKQKKAIIGTVQVFSELPKPLRNQTHYVYLPYTFLGCLTIVFKTKACYYDYDHERFTKKGSIFFFVHNKKLRESFDTYKKIEKYKDVEWATNDYFKGSDTPTTTVEVVAPK